MNSNIAIDIHGTLDTDPEFFKDMLSIIIEARTLVWIISGPPVEDMIAELTKMGFIGGVHYNGTISIVDFLQERNTDMWKDEHENWWAGDLDWWSAKGRMCAHYCIGTLIDNEIRYKQYMPGQCKFVLWEGREQWQKNMLIKSQQTLKETWEKKSTTD